MESAGRCRSKTSGAPTLVRKVFPRERLEGLDIPGPRSPLVYARLFLPEILDCERVLYLDSDLLVFRDVLELEILTCLVMPVPQ